MNIKFKKILSLVLLLTLFLPSLVKLEHQHGQSDLRAINEDQSDVFHNKCLICNFEFSIYIPPCEKIDLENENDSDSYIIRYTSKYLSNLSQFSFLLRAPPSGQI
jgi:hypothetical protein